MDIDEERVFYDVNRECLVIIRFGLVATIVDCFVSRKHWTVFLDPGPVMGQGDRGRLEEWVECNKEMLGDRLTDHTGNSYSAFDFEVVDVDR